MPTPVAHFLAGTAIYLVSTEKPRIDPRILVASVAAACLADIDFGIGFLLQKNIHHYFTHSIGFTLLFSGAVYVGSRQLGRASPASDALLLGASYLSHVVLDVLSEDTWPPLGVELFWPLSDRFYISPVPLFDNVLRGSLAKLFGLHNWLAVVREILIVGPVVALVLYWKTRQPE